MHKRGTGTRLFEAHELDVRGHPLPDAQSVALKDSWVKHTHKRQRPILDDILAIISPEERTYFLTVFAEGGVLVNGKQDDTTDLCVVCISTTAMLNSKAIFSRALYRAQPSSSASG